MFDERLEIETTIERHLEYQLPFAHFTTVQQMEYGAGNPPREEGSISGQGLARERFHVELQAVLLNADATRAPHIALGSGTLFEAYSEALATCASAAGIDEVWQLLQPSDEDVAFVTQEQYTEAAAALGFAREALLDLRSACSQYAASYPTLDKAVRDSLLKEVEDHYIQAVRNWYLHVELDEVLAK